MSAINAPRTRRPPGALIFFDSASPKIAGNKPMVDSAWLCGPDNESPMTLERTAQMPQETTAPMVHANHEGITSLLSVRDKPRISSHASCVDGLKQVSADVPNTKCRLEVQSGTPRAVRSVEGC